MTDPVKIGDATRIYALCEPWDADCPRYIGKTVQSLRLRRMAHLLAAERGGELPVHRWLRKRGGAIVRWIETVPPGEDWQERERYWIAAAHRNGHKILNLTDGGEGLPGHQFTDEHRTKIGDALRRGTTHSCDHCGETFYRKPKDARSPHLFCSRRCYAKWQSGKSKPMPMGVQALGASAAAAIKRLKTHCPKGHPYSGNNLYVYKDGRRACKECTREAKRRYRARCGRG